LTNNRNNCILRCLFMKKFLIISLIIIFSAVGWPGFALGQEDPNLLRIVSLRVSPSDTSATVYWSTNYPTTGYIQFGLSNGFGNWLEDNRLELYHETVLAGLRPEQTYYFRLEAKTADDRLVVSDTYNFETQEEDDNKAPIVSDVHTSFVTGNTATFVWDSNEPADSCVYYGTSSEDLAKKRCDGNKVKVHDLTVKDLKRNALYYYQVSSKDRAGNAQYSITRNFTTNWDDDENVPDLLIYEITPFNQRSSEDVTEVKITFKTNRPVEGYLRYGDKPGRYNKKVYLAAPRDTYSEILLIELDRNTVYYYQLKLEDILGKKLDTPEFSFTTLPSNILTQAGSLGLPQEEVFNVFDQTQDFDRDGLTNAQEEEYKADTDGDGYIDGLEVAHGYNPLGPGRLGQDLSQAGMGEFAYGQARLSSLTEEQNLALDLKHQLDLYFNSRVPENQLRWHTLVNAYIYGGYPVRAIAKAIQFSGKTVHPSIPFSAWKNTSDYKNYIDR